MFKIKMMNKIKLILIIIISLFSSCVSQKKYQEMVSQYGKQKSITKETKAKYNDLQDDYSQLKNTYNDTISILNDSIDYLNDSLNKREPIGDAALFSKIGELKLKIGALNNRLNKINGLIKNVKGTNNQIEQISNTTIKNEKNEKK